MMQQGNKILTAVVTGECPERSDAATLAVVHEPGMDAESTGHCGYGIPWMQMSDSFVSTATDNCESRRSDFVRQ
mgnify:CR=1 FL=1